MKLLLDTHTLVWWETNPSQIPTETLDLIGSSDHETMISVISFWELVIKARSGTFLFSGQIREVAAKQVANGLILLPVTIEHIDVLRTLPLEHKDPFDRLLIAQAIAESATMISVDRVFACYPVPVLW